MLVEGSVTKENDYLVAQGEHRGGPITGGHILKVKEGDVRFLLSRGIQPMATLGRR